MRFLGIDQCVAVECGWHCRPADWQPAKYTTPKRKINEELQKRLGRHKIIEVLRGQQIKLFHGVSLSDFHEYEWKGPYQFDN